MHVACIKEVPSWLRNVEGRLFDMTEEEVAKQLILKSGAKTRCARKVVLRTLNYDYIHGMNTLRLLGVRDCAPLVCSTSSKEVVLDPDPAEDAVPDPSDEVDGPFRGGSRRREP